VQFRGRCLLPTPRISENAPTKQSDAGWLAPRTYKGAFAQTSDPVHNTRTLKDAGLRETVRNAAVLHRKESPSCNDRRFVLVDYTSDARKLTKLSEIVSERPPEVIERALAAAKEELGLEVAFVSEFAEQRMIFRELVGDAESFGWRQDESIPLDDTFCRLLMEGRLPNVIPDAKNDKRVNCLDVTGEAGIGSYVGVPIRFSDGRLYGTLCALGHSPHPSLDDQDARFMRVLARLVAEQLEFDLRRIRKATTRARSHERSRISRELHDRVAHTMAMVHQSLQLYEVLRKTDPEKAAEKLELAKRMTKEAMEKTRGLSEALRATESGEKLGVALSELLRETVPPGMDRKLRVVGDEAAVSDDVREQLFIVLREAVRNAVSHSGADKVTVTISIEEKRIAGIVKDDGRGFDHDNSKPRERGGLAHMAERASLLGGECSIEAAPGDGTRVEVSFPLDSD
jgi:signal transduction histidine kinase